MESLEAHALLSSSLVSHALDHGVKLETPRTDYSATTNYTQYQIVTPAGDATPNSSGSSSPLGYTPSQIAIAYGINDIDFGATAGTGTDETIAIIDAYDDPSFVDSSASNFSSSDLYRFDQQFGIANTGFTFTKVSQTGTTTMPA
jgi:subtilase family serine protease